MDTLLLGITIVSLIVALITSVTAWRLMRDEKRRSAARIAALSAAAGNSAIDDLANAPLAAPTREQASLRQPWKPAPFAAASPAPAPRVARAFEPEQPAAPTHAAGFLGASPVASEHTGGQRGLAIATVIFFIAISGGFLWKMSSAADNTAAAATAGSTSLAPLELVSLNHARQDNKLAVTGLVRNPVAGEPVERLSAVVFLFDRSGTFVTSSRAPVDFLKLGAGDESPFVVAVDAPTTVARYRVSFRTDAGVVPHIDRRADSPVPAAGEQPVNVTLK